MTNKPFIICIVDDDEIYKFTVTRTIEIEKHADKVLTFADGEEAIKYIMTNLSNKENLPDVIFLDINMPIMDGFQFMEEYVKLSPIMEKKITIYMVTSSVDSVDLKRAEAISDISDYLIKPIDSKQISVIIDTLQKAM